MKKVQYINGRRVTEIHEIEGASTSSVYSVPSAATDPAGVAAPTTGALYFNTTTGLFRNYGASAWSDLLVWGDITGTLSSQTDLQTALAGKANTVHTHAAADVTSGVFAVARLGSGTANTTTFLRGDGTWAAPASGSTLNHYKESSDAGSTLTISGTNTFSSYIANGITVSISNAKQSVVSSGEALTVGYTTRVHVSGYNSTVTADRTQNWNIGPTNMSVIAVDSNAQFGGFYNDDAPSNWLLNAATITDTTGMGGATRPLSAKVDGSTIDMAGRGFSHAADVIAGTQMSVSRYWPSAMGVPDGAGSTGGINAGICKIANYRIFIYEVFYTVIGELGTILDKVTSGVIRATIFQVSGVPRIVGQTTTVIAEDPEFNASAKPTIGLSTGHNANGTAAILVFGAFPDRYSISWFTNIYEGRSMYRT